MRALIAAALGWSLLGAGLAVAQITGTVRVASGLGVPTYVVAPRDDFARLFVLRQAGEVLILDLVSGTIDPTPFLTIPVGGEGLQGLAFHPNYDVNGYFYVYYMAASPLRSVVERYSRDPLDPDLADPASAETVLEIPQPFVNHNGGWIGFGPDGYLYVAAGRRRRRRATPPTTARTWTRCSAACCGSTSTATTFRPMPIATTPSRRTIPLLASRGWTRSGPTACATRSGRASTA